MRIIYKCAVFCTISAIILGCAAKKDVNEKENVQKVSQKAPYGIWVLDKCSLKAERADTQIKITELYSKDKKVRVVMNFDSNLEETPDFRIYGLDDYDIELNGAGDTYSFEISTDIMDKARMILDDTFIQVTYRLEGMDYYRRAIYSMKNVPQAMLDIEKACKI